VIATAAASTNVIFTVIGVGLGSAVALANQLITTGATGRQARRDRLASIRQERKEAILKLLEIAQQVERLAEDRYFRRPVKNPEESTHRMWVLQKSLDLVATAPLHHAALNYAIRLNAAVYDPLPMGTKIWDFLEEERTPFLEAARQALDVQPFESRWQASGGWRARLRGGGNRRTAKRL
jgi:hypothetical protein